VRSDHPQHSFVALGPRAADLCRPDRRQYDFPFDEGGVLGRLYEVDAEVLYLGAPWTATTAWHLAEHRILRPPPEELIKREIAVVQDQGGRAYAYYDTLRYDVSDFDRVGELFLERHGSLYRAEPLPAGGPLRRVRLRDLVDLGEPILREVRGL
jgi:aminoglycoside 3-N-acetyltransferase